MATSSARFAMFVWAKGLWQQSNIQFDAHVAHTHLFKEILPRECFICPIRYISLLRFDF
jgi:hypothetical protein